MPYRAGRETAFPIGFDFTGEDAIVQNSLWRKEFLIVEVDPATGIETPLNFTGWGISMQIKATKDGPVLLELTNANGRAGIGTFGTAPGQYSIWLQLGAAATVGLTDWGLGDYDILGIDTSNEPHRIYEGDVTLSRNVST